LSRRPRALLAALLLSSPLVAQDAGGDAASAPGPATATATATATVTAEQAIATAQDTYGPPDARAKPACPTPKPGDEIIVCAQGEDNSKYRVKSSGDLDPTGAGAKDGLPRAPDVGTVYPGVVVAKGCFIPPCPPPMPVLIDLKAIPEAPPGSDADRVGRGLAPRGGPDAPIPAPTLPEAAPEPALRPPESASPAAGPSG
jgi:hypothetical protein